MLLRLTLPFILLFALATARAVEVGASAPSLAAVSGTGAKLALNDSPAKLTYVDFWASWCGPCKQSFPWMKAMHEKYGKDGLRVIAINVDKRKADADKFLSQFAAPFEIGFDPDGLTPAAYSVRAMPSSALVDRSGKVVWVHRGFRLEETAAMEREIQKRLTEAK
jgi:thiol-disulfide isomerase/thioredoxin